MKPFSCGKTLSLFELLCHFIKISGSAEIVTFCTLLKFLEGNPCVFLVSFNLQNYEGLLLIFLGTLFCIFSKNCEKPTTPTNTLSQ